jgi:PKD repeat protein
VHLTVRSSNKTTQGIVDWSQKFSVDVTPRSANIVAFANGQRLKTTEKVKLWLQEGQRGVVLDGSTTTARGWRILTNHRRDITGPNWFQATRAGEWVPWTLRVVLPDQGEYTVNLTVFDNQNNQLTEKFSLAIADPVSLIKQIPDIGNTSVTYTFDGSTSYSITSRLRLHTREIFDNNGNRSDTFQGKTITKQFARPGTYVVRLTVADEEGNENMEPRQVFVESTPPIAQFLSTPTPEILHPSEFVLDASVSSDIDVTNGFDTLTYKWEFSSPTTEIVESIEWGKKIRVLFNEVAKHKVKLTVIDQYGKNNTIEKEFDIKSTIRPKIFINPSATSRGKQVNFVAQTNKNVLWYEWDFGNGIKRTVQERNTSIIYQMIWVYKVTLKVSNGSEQNEITSLVFIGEKDSPIPGYSVENPSLGLTILQNDICEDEIWWQLTQVPAYKVDRYKDVTINATSSVNVKWEKNNLKMFFQPRNDQIFRDVGWSFNYKFNELGCQFINLTVEDDAVGKNSAVKIRFKVVNALPTLDNLILSYPQFGNDSWIGFQQAAAVQQEVFTTGFDPLIVKVTATNPIDADGSLSYFQRYYYDKNDPGRILGTKLSPGDVPHTFFSLPKTPGEFAFGVKMYDNDGGNQRSEDIIWNGPVVFFPPDTNRPDIPIVTLKVDKTNVEVGEEITFDIIARVLSDRPDFIQERVIQIDFDGDGEYDLTTKTDRITYTYTKPNAEWYLPKASVLYRGYRGVAKGENIIVKNGLKPRLLFDSADTLTLVRDISIGDIENQTICMDATACENPIYVRTGRDAGFIFTYPQIGKYIVSMDVIDKNANSCNTASTNRHTGK